MTEIFIFKTNVSTPEQLSRMNALFHLFRKDGFVKEWSVDMEDCDRILRVVALNLLPRTVERSLVVTGIVCEQLEYEL